MPKYLFVLLEGEDDERFISKIIKPLLQKNYTDVKLWKYARKKKEKINSFIKSVNSMGAEYIFLSDSDEFSEPDMKTRKLVERMPFLEKNCISIIVKEIESWYLAGINNNTHKKLKLGKKIPSSTESVSKEMFDNMLNTSFTRVESMIEILNSYDSELAMKRNNSFNKFITGRIG